jgi:hypothetical protein
VVGGCPAGAERRHRGEAAESEEGNATPDLLLKHPDATHATSNICVKTDKTLETYI